MNRSNAVETNKLILLHLELLKRDLKLWTGSLYEIFGGLVNLITT